MRERLCAGMGEGVLDLKKEIADLRRDVFWLCALVMVYSIGDVINRLDIDPKHNKQSGYLPSYAITIY